MIPAQFATPEFPLRASALPKLSQCPGSVALDPTFWNRDGYDDDEGGGDAAQTGNLVHSAAAEYHRKQGASEQERTEAGLAALEAARDKFPKGDVRRATKIWNWYASDKENLEADVVKCEDKVEFTLPCASFDPTGLPVTIRGTLDQIRVIDGKWTLWDIKTGKSYYGRKALYHYLFQQAAYVIGAEQTYEHEVHPGGLICTYGYEDKKQVIFHQFWDREDVTGLLFPIVVDVAIVRMGRVPIRPGDGCSWCAHKRPEACRLAAKLEGVL